MKLVPCSLEEANAFVAEHHRHHRPTPVAKFSIAAMSDSGEVVGVVIVGLPKARLAMDGWTLEVTRLASDGSRNACSFLYGAAARAAFALGFKCIGTYILAHEDGATLNAAGWRMIGQTTGRSWSTPSRLRTDKHPLGPKTLFEMYRDVR